MTNKLEALPLQSLATVTGGLFLDAFGAKKDACVDLWQRYRETGNSKLFQQYNDARC